jgi:hypothetical protein
MLLQAQEQYLMIGAADFIPHQDQADYYLHAEGLYAQSADTVKYYYAPLHLPEGVRIKRVVLFFYDNSSGNLQLSVYRNNKYTGGQDYIIGLTYTSGTPGDSTLTAYANWAYNLISNGGYSYVLRIHFTTADGSALKFYGAKVIYE